MRLSNWRQLKIRADLVISPQTHQGQLYYVVKDPVTLRYFRLRPTEYAIFRMFDGETPIDQIKKRLVTLGHDISEEELQAFIKQLGAANFFENVLPNQAESLYQMAALRRKKKSIWTQAKRILYIKVSLVDPDRFFTRAMPYVAFLWTPWAMLAYGLLMAFAVWAFFTNYAEAASHFSGLISPESLPIWYVIFVIEKSFHELGHGFTCKRFGGQVHDMGALVLVLTPCMYCNISDAWMLEKPSRKFWISAAGIITEVVIASIAALVWYFTGPGTAVNSLAYRVMILAGVSSVFINGNPLMKWDGYYILSDLMGMPNMRENSVRYIGQSFRRYALGMDVPNMPAWNRETVFKLVYGILSSFWVFYVMYRITSGMLQGFPALGAWILVSTVYGLVLIPVVRMSRYFARQKGKPVDVDLARLSGGAAIAVTLAYALFVYNAGYSVSAPCVILPAQSQSIKAPVDGILADVSVEEGGAVTEGAAIARLENPALEIEARELKKQIESYDVQIDAASSEGSYIVADNLAKTRDEVRRTLGDTERRLASLSVKAPFSGVILTPNPKSQLGRFLSEGDAICEIGDMSRARVSVALEDKDLRFVRRDADVSVTLRAYPWRTFKGAVAFVSGAPVHSLPSPALSSRIAGGPVITRTDTAQPVPIMTTYEASFFLANPSGEFLVGMVGTAEIQSGTRHWYDIIYTKVRENLRKSFGI